MKIVIEEDNNYGETEVVLRCKRADEEVLRMLAVLRAFEKRLTGAKDGRTFVVEASEVLYAESVDRRTFFYTKADVFETPLRLYELEERLADGSFFRASKACIANLQKVESLRPSFGGRIELRMENGEELLVSRQYAPDLKRKLEL